MALAPLWAARDYGFLSEAPILVHVDAHTDWADDGHDYSERLSRIQTLEDILLCANALKSDDGGWIDFVLRCGWVTRVLALFAHDDLLQLPAAPLEDIHGTCRPFAVCTAGGATHVVGTATEPEASRDELVRQFASLERSESEGPLWLDIDLDFALPPSARRPFVPRSYEELRSWFDEPALPHPRSPSRHALMDTLLRRAKLVTIATEPEYTGGFAGVDGVLSSLARLFPEHEHHFTWFK
jgi:hypothetical protein